jgi:hypothetical protein
MEMLIWGVYLLILGALCAGLASLCDRYRHHGCAAFLGGIAGTCFGIISAVIIIAIVSAPPLFVVHYLETTGWIK